MPDFAQKLKPKHSLVRIFDDYSRLRNEFSAGAGTADCSENRCAAWGGRPGV
jgi:hypothetical protein